MSIENIRLYCLSKPGVEETLPFDEVTPVYKVKGKMFALLGLDEKISLNLKCDPEKAIQLREQFDYVIPGYHMNKTHWNTVILQSNTQMNLLYEWIDDSYQLVVNSLPKKLRLELEKEE